MEEENRFCNIFISYQWKSQPNVKKLYAELESLEGVNVYNATTNSNSSFANINLTQLTAGVYFIKVTQNGATSVQKLVKQ